MAPKSKDAAWAHAKVVEGKIYCRYCKKLIKGGGIHRLKQHLAGIRGNVAPCEVDSEVIGEIRLELLQQFEQYEVEKTNQREREAEIGKKRHLAEMIGRSAPYSEYEGSSSIPSPSPNFKDTYQYVPPPSETNVSKKGSIHSFFSPQNTPSNAAASRPIQPTIDAHWKKQYRMTAHEYIARWWYDADIPFNAARSPYFQPMWDSVVAAGKGFKGPSLHDLRGSLLQKEIESLNVYFKEFKESRAITR